MTHDIKAVIFDMDGVLVNSESLWQHSELLIFPQHGVPLTLADTLKTQGLRTDEVVNYWHQRYPWNSPSKEQVNSDILSEVIHQIEQKAAAMPGVYRALENIIQQQLPIGLATSSSQKLVDAVLAKLNITNVFDAIETAEHLPYGKPHPQVYLNTAKKLGIKPEQCLAIEDSFNGILSAKSAKMTVLTIPDQYHNNDERFVIADYQFESLEHVTSEWIREVISTG